MVRFPSVAPAKFVAFAATLAHAIILIISLVILQPAAAAADFDGASAIVMMGDIDDSGDAGHTGFGDPALIPPIHVFDFDEADALLCAVDWNVWFKGRCTYCFHARDPPAPQA